jgi:hypothetical protein
MKDGARYFRKLFRKTNQKAFGFHQFRRRTIEYAQEETSHLVALRYKMLSSKQAVATEM